MVRNKNVTIQKLRRVSLPIRVFLTYRIAQFPQQLHSFLMYGRHSNLPYFKLAGGLKQVKVQVIFYLHVYKDKMLGNKIQYVPVRYVQCRCVIKWYLCSYSHVKKGRVTWLTLKRCLPKIASSMKVVMHRLFPPMAPNFPQFSFSISVNVSSCWIVKSTLKQTCLKKATFPTLKNSLKVLRI